MKKPHVSILHYTAPPIVGGVEGVIADHTRLLVESGYPVTLVTGRGGTAPALAGANVEVLPEIDSEFPENVRIARALEEGRVPSEFKPLQARIEDQLVRAVARADILIVHNVLNFHFNMPLTAALYSLLDRRSIPLTVAWCHDISRYTRPASGAEQRHGFPWDLLRECRGELTYVVVSSRRRQMLADVLGCSLERLRVIPNGIWLNELLALSDFGSQVARSADLPSADLILLMPVRVTQAKNIEFALRVVATLKESGRVVRMIITGPPDPHAAESRTYFERLVAQRNEWKLEQEVLFLCEGLPGLPHPLAVDRTKVGELYRLSDIVFLPSHREGFGLPVLEGGIVGRVVFSSPVPAVDEVGGEMVYTISQDESPEQVAARMVQWAEQDPTQRLRRRVRQRYTWGAVFCREIEPLLADCVERAKERV